MKTLTVKIEMIEKSVKINLVRNPISAKHDDWKKTAFQWSIEINLGGKPSIKTDFFCGIGHHEPRKMYSHELNEYKRLKNANLTDIGLKRLLGYIIPSPPKFRHVLNALALDSMASEMSFSDWCSEFGYDEDSIKATKLYLDCQESGKTLRKLGFTGSEIQELRNED